MLVAHKSAINKLLRDADAGGCGEGCLCSRVFSLERNEKSVWIYEAFTFGVFVFSQNLLVNIAPELRRHKGRMCSSFVSNRVMYDVSNPSSFQSGSLLLSFI